MHAGVFCIQHDPCPHHSEKGIPSLAMRETIFHFALGLVNGAAGEFFYHRTTKSTTFETVVVYYKWK